MIPGSANPLLLKSAAAAGPVQIERSLRFNSSDSASLSRASYAGSGTFSCWVKRCKLGTAQTIISGVAFNASDQLNSSTAVFRDPSAWMHVLVSTSGTYVNGTSVASGSAITPGIIGSGCDLYLADIYFIDGQALTPSSFTEVSATTGQLIPKAYTGTFTGNSFWLKFSDNSSTTSGSNVGIGKDFSGLGNYWNSTNLSVTAGAGNDSLVDTPTSYGTDTYVGGEVRGNYCTLNPLDSGGGTVSNGNLEHTFSSSNTRIRSTISIPETGKWYAEFVASNTGGGNSLVGVSIGTNALTGTNWYLGNDAGSWGCQIGSGTMYTYNAGGFSSFGTAASGDVIAVAVDRAAGKIWWAVNNTWIGSGDPANGTNARYTNIPSTGTLFFAISNASNSSIVCNFGQRPFAHPLSGFKALCDTNLTAPVVAKPNTVMDVVLYTGNSSARSITGFSFSPDFVWIKPRSVATQHNLYDAVRGATKALFSDFTDAEATVSNGLTAFNNDGFSLGSNQYVNNNAVTFVAWAWDAGEGSAVSNTAGSITSSVRANASAGFSIVTYTGTGANATVGHGLGVEPQMVIVKSRTVSNTNWVIYHTSLGGTNKVILLNSTDAPQTVTDYWGSAAPTSTVFGVANGAFDNNNGNLVAYCFAPVAGYSSFGSYTGNGSTSDNTFVYTGMRPRFVMLKRSDSTGNWVIWDAVRNSYNVANSILLPNSSAAEYSPDAKIDILSNGFKVRDNSSDSGTNGATYIYAAFAENPFQFSRAR